jgi:DNA-binding NtrC family response regulator
MAGTTLADRVSALLESLAEPEPDMTEHWPHSAALIVDDEPGMRNFLEKTLASRFGQVHGADSAEAGAALVSQHRHDLIILDITLPGKSGLAWLRELREQGQGAEVVLITAFADLDMAIEALRAGASDFILKPFRVAQILNAVRQCMERSRLASENFLLRRRLSQQNHDLPALVGRSGAMRALSDALVRVGPASSPVLLRGESGTGKELAAQTIHQASQRAAGPFVRMHCSGLAPEWLESELFGHAPGAFAGAAQARDGLFHYARGGTLFLDEVGELPLGVQAGLLRVLEEQQVRPIGSEQKSPADVRLIASTDLDLAAEVAAGRFRKDLYYRLQVLEIALPPLRAHKEDLGLLFEHFVALLAPQLGCAPLRLSETELHYLQQYDWPGNVRELRNLVERSLILGALNVTALYQAGRAPLPASATPNTAPLPLVGPDTQPGAAAPTDLHTLEKRHILSVLDAVQGDKGRAAQLLGISRRTLERRVAEWNSPHDASASV